jgi:hypothetical protein
MKIDVDKDKKQEVVPAVFLRKRMGAEFIESVKNPEDMGETIKKIAEEIGVNEPILKQVVEKRLKILLLF